MTGSRSDAEFDEYAGWTADAVRALGAATHAIPAGCRGSASPAALVWLGEALELSAGEQVLDAGAGVGGAAAWFAARYGVEVTCAEPALGAVRAARALFPQRSLTAAAERLPFREGHFAAAWALGVLSTTHAHDAVLRELHRVLAPGGRLGLLVYAAAGAADADVLPENHFPVAAQLPELLARSGFTLIECQAAAGLPPAPRSWTDRISAVESHTAAAHSQDAGWRAATDGAHSLGVLLRAGKVSVVLVHARRAGDPRPHPSLAPGTGVQPDAVGGHD